MEERVIRVFISSTFEDFKDERTVVTQAISDLNPLFAKKGIALVPVDMMKIGARPNPSKTECLKELASCKVMIGLLGLRYGQPDIETGKSITELEYDKACELKIPPLMYISIRKILPEWMDTEPGLVSKLNAFKKKVELAHMRDKFETCGQLREHVLLHLARTILDEIIEGKPQESQNIPVNRPETEEQKMVVSSQEKNNKKLTEGMMQAIAVLDRVHKNLGNESIEEITDEDKMRLFILGGSMLPFGVHLEEVGNHPLHKFYLNREKVKLTNGEKGLIYRTLVRDSWDLKTGWFWLQDLKSKGLLKALEISAVSENTDDVWKKRSVTMLQIMEPRVAEASLVKIIKDCQHEEKRNILDYLCAHGSKRTLKVVERLMVGEHEGVTSKAVLAKIGILSRCDPAQAVKIMIEEAKKDAKIFEETGIKTVIKQMSTRNLRKLSATNCVWALKEIGKQGKASEKELRKMIETNDPETRYLGYYGLLKKGFIYRPEEIKKTWPRSASVFSFGLFKHYPLQGEEWLAKTLLEVYLKMPTEELEKNVEFIDQEGEGNIYLAWGLRGGYSVIDVVRNDIKGMFKRLKDACLAEIEKMNSDTEKKEELKKRVQNIESRVTKIFTASALKVLEKCGNVDDINMAKTFLKDEDIKVRTAAVSLLAKYAKKRDIDMLLEIGNSNDEEGRIVAVKRILQLDGGGKFCRNLLDSSYSNVVREVIHWFIANGKILEFKDILGLVLSKNDDIRLLATAYAVNLWPRQKQVSLLQKYHGGKIYYYDVVCWLDRVLYAPSALSQGYKKKLLERLN